MKRFERPAGSHVAIHADAFGGLFPEASRSEPVTLDGVAVVSISGPLTTREEGWFDNYDAIRARCAQAFASASRAVVLRINSPGGDASGCYELSRELRAMSERTGKPLFAFADSLAASAAYAIACAASRIHVAETGFLGSIGCLKPLVSFAERDRAAGLRVELVASGGRKTDGHPAVPITEAALAAAQAEVDALAAIFFELVASSRGMSTEAVEALDAGVFHGARAVVEGLADQVSTFEGLLAVASGNSGEAAKESTMDLKEIVAALKAKAEGDGEEAEQARKALVAMGEGEEPKKDGEEKAEGDEDEPKASKAEGDDGDAPLPPKKDEDEPKASKASSFAGRLAALEKSERAQLLATRPDLPAKTRAWLESAPIEVVRDAVVSIERPKVPNLAQAATVRPTLPAGAGGVDGRADMLPPEEARALDEQMGLSRRTGAIRQDGTRLVLGVMTPAEARAELARRKDGAR